MKYRRVGGVMRFVVMWATVTVIVTTAVVALGVSIFTAPYFTGGEELTGSEILEAALTSIIYEGPTLALIVGAPYLLSLLAAVGVSRLNRKLHWLAFPTAGLVALVPFILPIAPGLEPQGFIVIGLFGVAVGLIAGWIWSGHSQTASPLPPA